MIEFITSFGLNGLYTFGFLATGWAIAFVVGVLQVLIEHAKSPFMAFFSLGAVIAFIWTLIQFAGG